MGWTRRCTRTISACTARSAHGARRAPAIPWFSSFEEFLYESDKPLHGDLTSFAYRQRGAIAYVCELWDLFAQAGIPRKKPYILHYTNISRDEFHQIARWDRDHNQGRIVRPWRPFRHPQLGDVEIGGRNARVGIQNPPYERIAEVCTKQASAILQVTGIAPDVVLCDPQITAIDGNSFRVEITVENRGYLPSYVLASAKSLPWNHPLYADAIPHDGLTLALGETDARREVGHLDGWGRGMDASLGWLVQQYGKGSVSRRRLAWVVSGRGTLTIRAGGCRTGLIEQKITVP